MRKSYSFKKLGRQVQRLAAIMLVTLMAVGNVFAEELTVVFSEQGYTDTQVLTEGTFNEFISFVGAQNEASSAPKYYDNGTSVRFYAKSATGNGSSMTLIPQAGYEITGLVINATGASNAPTIGVEVDGGDRVMYEADGAVYTLTGLHATSSLMFINAATSNTQLRITSITITYGEAAPPAVYAPEFSVPSGNYYTEQTVNLTCATPGANIFYSINGAEALPYNAPFTVSATAAVSAYAVLGEDTSAVTTVNYTFPVFLNNIAAYYAAENANLFKITGDVTFVYRNGRYIYVKDETGGLLLYDSYNSITTEYNEGDVISGGLIGTRSIYNGLDELVPTFNTAEGVAGETVVPTVVTAAELLANTENYVSQLVMVVDGEFAAGSFNTNSATKINFTQNGSTIVVRNGFKTVSKTFSAGDKATVVGFVTIYNNEVQLFPRNNDDIISTALPFACNFGERYVNNIWTLANGDNTNKWYIGQANGFDNDKLYISSSNGITNKYNVSAASNTHAYMYTELPNTDVLLSFDVRTVGDENDYLQVSVLDEAPVAGTLPETYFTRIYGVNDFTTQNVVIPAAYAGGKYIVFTWHNNASGGTQAPAAIDNVTMTTTCTTPTDLAVTVTDQTAVVTWNAPADQTAWTLQYKDANNDAWQTVNATSTSVTLNNLTTEMTYDVRVKANCGENSSLWLNGQFYVACVDLTTAPMEITIGTGTSSSTYTPMNAYYKNSWTQMIYPASEFGTPGYINSLSWYVNATNAHNYQTLKIYLGTKSSATHANTTDWLSMDDLTLVYESNGGTIGSTVGWETYTLTTPYYYNGEDNLVVVTARTADNYKSLNYRYTSVSGSVLYRRSDSSPENYGSHPGTNSGSSSSNLPNMMVDFLGYVCGDEHCAAPADLTVSNITTTGATLNWEAGDATAWVLGYKAENTDEWTIVNLTDNQYELTDLVQNTSYAVRVMADCGTVGMSSEAAVNFTTVANCIAPQNLTADVAAHTVNVSWLPVDGINAYEAVVTGTNNDFTTSLNIQNGSQFDLTGLAEGGQYNIKVRAICSEEETSDWSAIDFTMPTICVAPTGLTVVENGENAATITWNAGFANAWTVEYGAAGFTLGTGTQVLVNENTITLTGLNAYSYYDVYVMADCGLGYLSEWSSKLGFRTECGPITITAENPWIEDFESYTGSGNLAFDDCWATPEMTSFNSPFIYRNYASAAHSGKNSAELKGNSGAVATLVLPAFTNSLSDLQFSYYGRVTGSTPGTMQLGYITDATDASTFVEVMEIPAQSGSYNRANAMLYGPFTFGDNVPEGARITLRFTSATGSCSWNLDDFTVEMKPDCTSPLPASVTVSNISATQATVAWTDDNTNNTAWRIYYKASGETDWTSEDVTENPVTITGLTSLTTYEVYVATVCGTEESEGTNTVTFTTSMVPTSLPYMTNFTGNDWKLNNGTCTNKWTMGTPSNKDYPGLFISNDGSTAGYTISSAASCVSAEKLFDLPSDATIHVAFDLESGGESTYDYLKVFFAPSTSEYPATTTNTSGTYTHYTYSTYALNFTPYLTQTGCTYTSTNYQYKINLTKGAIMHIEIDVTNPAPNGQGKLVFFWRNDNSTGTQPGAIISNLQVGDLSCLPVTALAVSNVTGSSADLTWTPGAVETEWNVAYKTEEAEEWTTVTTATNSYTIAGLEGLTTYQVAVTPVCDGASAEAATATFTTLCGNQCDYTFVLHDSYGDGWNGNTINVVFSDGTSMDLTLTGGNYGSFDVNIPEGATMTCNWTEGSWVSETSFEIIDGCGAEVYSASGTAQSAGFFTGSCPLSACPKPGNLVVSNLSTTSAIVSWTPAGEENAWVVSYSEAATEDWQTTTVTTTSFAMTGLNPNTEYVVNVKADCGDEQSNASSVTFSTYFAGCEFTFDLVDSWGDGWNGNAIELVYSNGTSQSITIESGSSATYNITIPDGQSMVCNWIAGSYPNETSFTITDVDGNVVYSGSSTQTNGFFVSYCVQTTCPAPLALSATEVDENGTSVITWFAGGEETSWHIALIPEEGNAITDVVTSPTYTITGMQPGDAYTVIVKAICSEEDESEEVSISVVCPALVDIAMVDVYTNPSNCDLSNMIARITVKNMMESPISSFEAYYQVNGGPVVHETVWPYLSFDYGETYTYTFNTAPTFTQATNVITAWVTVPSETNTDDNMANSGITYLTEEQALPYVETFPAASADNWAVVDNNMDNSSFVVTGSALKYFGSDESSANDYAVSPCVEYTPGTYIMSFDYKANSPFYNEAFSFYYGPSTNLYNDYWVKTFQFNNAEYQHYDYVGTLYMSMDNLHVAFKAESAIGTDGFTIDNLSIQKAVSFSVANDGNGSVTVSNATAMNSYYYTGEGEEVTLYITSNFGHHVSGIYVNGVLVRGENQNNSILDSYTFVPENGDYVYVTFTSNVYKVQATVNNLYYTAYMNNAPGAIYTPSYDEVAHGGAHHGVITLKPHFHFETLAVNGMDYTNLVTDLGNGQYALTLDPVMENKDINVVVDLDSTSIVYTVEAGQGTINNEFVVDGTTTLPAIYTVTLPGYSDLLSTIVPAPGYHIASIIIDGVEHTNVDSYSFEHLFGTHTVVVNFALNHYVITTAGYGNGTVSPGAEFDYNPDYTYVFTATPAAGYRIGTLTRNNVAMAVADPAAGFTDTLTNILSDYNYEVFFVQNTYTITATCGANGTISPAGASAYLYHQNAIYNITAAPGYYIASVTVDGTTTNYTQADALTSTTYTFANVAAAHTISATFAAMEFEITVNAGDNGSITPATASYAYGATPTFTITPNAGYSIADVTVDGNSIGAVATYTFPALNAAHTIAATFAANAYTITATAGNGGTISPAGASTVAYNTDKTYTISANTGYHVSDVFVDGVSVGAVTSYTFTGVTANHAIYAAFEANEYTVTVNQPAHGTITPGTTTVLYGATPSFVITPATGYNVTAITVNGSNVNLNNVPNVNGTYTYTFAAISNNQTITATMTAKTYTITASAGTNGSITPNGNTTVNHGGSQVYTITPANGYVVAQVTVDGMSIGAPTSYVFTNVVANHTINATFALAECEAPTYLYTTHIDSTSAMLHWSHPSATTFNIQYKTPTGNFTTVASVSGNSYQLTDLTPATTYLWQVQAVCASNNQSDWANLVSFQTDNSMIDETGIEDLVKNNIKVYAEHQNVHILNNEGMNIDNVRIFDAYGKLIYSGAVNTTHEVISLNVAAGAYVVNVTTDKGVANYKVTILK